MPPKRAKNANGDTLQDNGEDSAVARKKPQRGKPHDAVSLVVDVGSTSALHYPNDKETDLQRSKQVADWILSRKVAQN